MTTLIAAENISMKTEIGKLFLGNFSIINEILG
jgi:hypothetical protein